MSRTTAEKASTGENKRTGPHLPNLWGWFLAPPVPVLTYAIPATFIAGIQASPGAGIMNLIVYTVLALPIACYAVLILLGTLTGMDSNVPFNSALILGILALVTGMVVPWIVGPRPALALDRRPPRRHLTGDPASHHLSAYFRAVRLPWQRAPDGVHRGPASAVTTALSRRGPLFPLAGIS